MQGVGCLRLIYGSLFGMPGFTWKKHEGGSEYPDFFTRLVEQPEEREGILSYTEFLYSFDVPGAEEYLARASRVSSSTHEVVYSLNHPDYEPERAVEVGGKEYSGRVSIHRDTLEEGHDEAAAAAVREALEEDISPAMESL
ncbi:MAG: hypothetical protein ABEJ66_02730 [Candidatus Nanohaloarchaea archaeon]